MILTQTHTQTPTQTHTQTHTQTPTTQHFLTELNNSQSIDRKQNKKQKQSSKI